MPLIQKLALSDIYVRSPAAAAEPDVFTALRLVLTIGPAEPILPVVLVRRLKCHGYVTRSKTGSFAAGMPRTCRRFSHGSDLPKRSGYDALKLMPRGRI